MTIFDTFCTAKIHREHDFCPDLFCTDLCAKIDVRMITYHFKMMRSKFEVDFEKSNF